MPEEHTTQDQGAQDVSMVQEDTAIGGVQDITQEMSQVNLQLYDINEQNYEEIFIDLDDAIQTIPSATEIYLDSQRQLLDFVAKSTKKLSLQQNIRLTRKIGELSLAVEKRAKELQQPQVNVQQEVQKSSQQKVEVNEQTQDDYALKLNKEHQVQFFHLYQFMNNMGTQVMRETTETLPQLAKRQLTHYKAISMIDSVTRRKNPNRPYTELFKIQGKFYISQLAKDQCQWILNQITPTENSNRVQSIEMPTFNPDFQFYWTVLFNTNNYPIWQDFQGEHKSSRVNYNNEKKIGLTIQAIEAKFAFEVGCKWIQLRIDPTLNVEFNEKFGFALVNGYVPTQAPESENCRCLLARGMDNGVWDGEYVYFHTVDANAFVRAFCRLHEKMHISFKVGCFAINILPPNTLPNIAQCMPMPQLYEQIIPIHCGWLNLNKSQLTNLQRQRYCSCLGFGGVYLPYFAHINGAVTGKLINMTPRFVNSIAKEKETHLFQWHIEKGQFVICETPQEQLFKYQSYMSEQLPDDEVQQEKHERTKPYTNFKLDKVVDRVYGSMHFWSWYDRVERYNTLTNTPNTIRVDFANGQNPYFPEYKNDPQATHFLVSSNKELSESQKDTLYRSHVDQECMLSIEQSMRFRRSQFIMGYNSPHLCWHQPQGTQLSFRFPTTMEMLGTPLPQTSIDYFRTIDFKNYSWIPKILAPHYDVLTDSYFKSQRELLYIRMDRINEAQMQIHAQPQAQLPQKTNKRLKKK